MVGTHRKELDFLVEQLEMSKEEVEAFLEIHDRYLEALNEFSRADMAITILLTTAVALSVHNEIGPDGFMRIMHEVVSGLIDPSSTVAPGAEPGEA